jgi:hypothetical protein
MKPCLMNIYEYVPAVFIQCVDFPSQQATVLHLLLIAKMLVIQIELA